MKKIYIIDYGIGNVGSLLNVIKYLNFDVKVTKNLSELKNADFLFFPGVGRFDSAMRAINEINGLKEIIHEKVLIKKTPFLGICLGMQLLFKNSEEGNLEGLDLIEGSVKKFKQNINQKIPHMGWNNVIIEKNNPLVSKNELNRFYFVHSYYVKVKNNFNSIGTTNYIENFNSIVAKDNIFGVQFHPEKSHKYGINLIKNFLSL